MSIRLCIGDYAKKGYEPANMGCRIYCLEELCFFIRENAGLLDENFVSEECSPRLAYSLVFIP